MPEAKTARNIIYCDQCHDLLYPPEQFYAVGGKIICTVCWESPQGGGK